MIVRFATPSGSHIHIDKTDEGEGVHTYPTTEPTFGPWQEVLRRMATEGLQILPYDPHYSPLAAVSSLPGTPAAIDSPLLIGPMTETRTPEQIRQDYETAHALAANGKPSGTG